jgi:flagellar biosynthesis GTPase FlhF
MKMKERYTRDVVGTFLEATSPTSAHHIFRKLSARSGMGFGEPESVRLMKIRMAASNEQSARTKLTRENRAMFTRKGTAILNQKLKMQFRELAPQSVGLTTIRQIAASGAGPGTYLDAIQFGQTSVEMTAKELQQLLLDNGAEPGRMVIQGTRRPYGRFGPETMTKTQQIAAKLGFGNVQVDKWNCEANGLCLNVRIHNVEFVKAMQGLQPTPAPGPDAPANEFPMIRVDTKELQSTLLKLGADPAAMISSKTKQPDGVFGTLTRQELVRICAKHNLPLASAAREGAYTKLTPASTWSALQSLAAKASGRVIVGTEALQKMLKDLGTVGITKNGILSAGTIGAYKSAAKMFGLSVETIQREGEIPEKKTLLVPDSTWYKLLKESRKAKAKRRAEARAAKRKAEAARRKAAAAENERLKRLAAEKAKNDAAAAKKRADDSAAAAAKRDATEKEKANARRLRRLADKAAKAAAEAARVAAAAASAKIAADKKAADEAAAVEAEKARQAKCIEETDHECGWKPEDDTDEDGEETDKEGMGILGYLGFGALALGAVLMLRKKKGPPSAPGAVSKETQVSMLNSMLQESRRNGDVEPSRFPMVSGW